MNNGLISVLICDDSALMRNIVRRIVEADPQLTVVGEAINGRVALDQIRRLNPDVMVLDLEMPEMDGIEFLKKRKKWRIATPVVILSSLARRGAKITMEALSLGASDFIMKPTGDPNQNIKNVGKQLVTLLKAYGLQQHREKQKKLRRGPATKSQSTIPRKPPLTPKSPPGQRKPATGKINVIAFGISTGGPNALREVFAHIDPELPVPMVVVQHMPPEFTREFAVSLNRICPLQVKEAENEDLLKPRRILIAPGDHQMEVERRQLSAICRISKGPPRNGHRPSADVLFRSVAKVFEGNSLGVIMTGMGKDGATEMGAIYREGGITLAQDEESSVIYGMPRVALENGYIDHIVALKDMADTINRIVAQNSYERSTIRGMPPSPRLRARP